MKIEVLNWRAYVKRGDIDRPTWFAFPNRLYTDPEFMGVLKPETIAVFAYVCVQATRANGTTVVNFLHATSYVGIDEAGFRIQVDKLQRLQLVHVHVTEANAGVTPALRECSATRITREDNITPPAQPAFDLPTDQVVEKMVYDPDHESVPEGSSPSLPKLALLWNEHADPVFARVKGCSATRTKHARNRWRENPREEYWLEVIKAMGRSPFLTGRIKAWKADFDFLIRPESANKVLEGKYEQSAPPAAPRGGQGPEKRPNTWFKTQVEGGGQ